MSYLSVYDIKYTCSAHIKFKHNLGTDKYRLPLQAYPTAFQPVFAQLFDNSLSCNLRA